MAITTIQLDNKTKAKLDSLKIHHRETYNDIIKRLISDISPQNANRESLIATIEVLSDPKSMRDLKQSLQEKGGTSLEEVKKELNL